MTSTNQNTSNRSSTDLYLSKVSEGCEEEISTGHIDNPTQIHAPDGNDSYNNNSGSGKGCNFQNSRSGTFKSSDDSSKFSEGDTSTSHHKNGNGNRSIKSCNISVAGTKSSVRLKIDDSVLQLVTELERSEHRHSVAGVCEDNGERKSQLCCFCLCDLVKANVVTNSIFIFLVAFYLIVSFLPDSDIAERLGVVPLVVDDEESFFDDDDDDEFRNIVSGDGYDDDQVGSSGVDPWLVISYVKLGGAFFFCTMGIIGALRFHEWLVLSNAVWYIVYGILNISDRENKRWIGTFISVFFSYPPFHLFLVLHNKRITEKNYKLTEEYCCFCPTGE